jgi:hypothetical protein
MAGSIHPLVANRLRDVEALCRKFLVRRLDLFGSATSDRFDPLRSDLDFLIEYLPEAKVHYFDAYFGLKEGLEGIFGRHVDLVMTSAIRSPHFRAEAEETRVQLYAA